MLDLLSRYGLRDAGRVRFVFVLREEVKTLFINLTEDLLQLQNDIAALIDVASQAGADFNKTRLELEDHYKKCALYTLEQQIQHYTDESKGR